MDLVEWVKLRPKAKMMGRMMKRTGSDDAFYTAQSVPHPFSSCLTPSTRLCTLSNCSSTAPLIAIGLRRRRPEIASAIKDQARDRIVSNTGDGRSVNALSMAIQMHSFTLFPNPIHPFPRAMMTLRRHDTALRGP